MRLLLDTHAFVWWVTDSPALSAAARAGILAEENDVFVSAASAWEISTKHRLGKLPVAAAFAKDVERYIAISGFESVSISVAHAQYAGGAAGAHRDPFDRLIAAQAVLEGMVLVSKDAVVESFGARRLW